MDKVLVAMAAELAVYGLVTGFLYQKVKARRYGIYIALLTAMISGRIIWGIVSFGLFYLLGNTFTWNLYVMNGFIYAIPGIVFQLLFIPVMVKRLRMMKEVDIIV